MKIAIATDHAGREVKLQVIKYLKENNIAVTDLSQNNTPTDDYPDFAFAVCQEVVKQQCDYGILICTTGIGICIAANKVKGIRCANCHSVNDAKMTRCDNNANVLAFSSQLAFNLIKEIIKTFINTEFSNEKRHIRRVEKIIKYENGEYNEL